MAVVCHAAHPERIRWAPPTKSGLLGRLTSYGSALPSEIQRTQLQLRLLDNLNHSASRSQHVACRSWLEMDAQHDPARPGTGPKSQRGSK